MKQTQQKETCREMFRPFLEKNFQHWQPWNEACIKSGMNTFFIKQGESMKSTAGEDRELAYFSYYRAENYSDQVRIWTRNDMFLKLEAEYPDIDIKFDNSFRLPDAQVVKLDYSFDVTVIKQGEWVYPEKGIAYFFNSDYNRVIKIAVFLPTTIETYRKLVRGRESVREFER